jgi:serine/threonine protein kinase
MNTVNPPAMILGGRYRLLTLAGRGGMAEVWRAEVLGAAGFRRTVAIKRVLPELANTASFQQMFVEEARVMSLLSHPNIVQVFDFDEDPSGFYLALEWVEGTTLRELADLWISTGRQPSCALVAAIGIEVLRALEAAHSHEVQQADGSRMPAPIIHRDVSPSNVLLSRSGVVKLTDFGLARAFDRARITPPDVVKGKIAYLPPEQVRGPGLTVRSDLYSVGVMLWELCCGRRMYQGLTDADIVQSLLRRLSHPPVRSFRAEVPESLAQAIDCALSAEPEKRFASAAEFARALSDGLRLIPERTDATRLGQEVRQMLLERAALRAAGEEPEIPVEYSVGGIETIEELGLSSLIVLEEDGSVRPGPPRDGRKGTGSGG